MKRLDNPTAATEVPPTNAIELEIFKHLFAAIAEEMGTRLMRSAYSPNIKERRDFSCALFDARGELLAQAAHIPVHLGAMPLSVQAVINSIEPGQLTPASVFVHNDPFAGGTHLPDITVVAPCILPGKETPDFWVANRAHHADIGGITPGSMPLSTCIADEGLLISAQPLDAAAIYWICQATRTPEERRGDLRAQVAAVELGQSRLASLCLRHSVAVVAARGGELLDYSARILKQVIAEIPDGVYEFSDVLDGDGHCALDIAICCRMTITGAKLTVDLRDSGDQVPGPVNAVRAIAVSAVNYVLRCLAPLDLPSNGGVMRGVQVLTRPGSIVDAQSPAAVAAGNVETSQRLVDVLLGALAQAVPHLVPAASCGSMNNLTIGGHDPRSDTEFAYYETLAGGAGAGPHHDGAAAIHTHMTNTLNTPVEAVEHAYPLQVNAYRIRHGSGGPGLHRGGDGLVREYSFAGDAEITLLAERRSHAPYGLAGGMAGIPGVDSLCTGVGQAEALPGKFRINVRRGQRLLIATPGGGGWGNPVD